MDNSLQDATFNIEPNNSVSDLPSPENSISSPAASQDMTSLHSTQKHSQYRLLDSTISMVTSMQGAIFSLLTSILNSLLLL